MITSSEQPAQPDCTPKPARALHPATDGVVPQAYDLPVANGLYNPRFEHDACGIGFVAHVEAELKQRAQEAGANMVLARSAFSTSLPQILKRHSGSM